MTTAKRVVGFGAVFRQATGQWPPLQLTNDAMLDHGHSSALAFV